MLEIATAWEMGKLAYDAYRWTRRNLETNAAHAIPRIERFINRPGQPLIRIFGVRVRPPRVTVIGDVDPGVVGDRAEALRSHPALLNDPHALVEGGDDAQTPEIKVRTTDFAHILALRQQAGGAPQPLPPILSANALLVCPERKRLVVHRRSDASATYGGSLHLFGGAYRPPIQRGDFDSPGDRMSLEFTMVREVFEESGLIVRSRAEPVAVAHELDTGFVQYVFLGVRITAAECERLSSNSEGNAVEIPFAQLGARLSDSAGWVPSGRAHLLAWLGLGAPGAGFRPRFGKATPTDLFDQVVGES